MKHLLAVAVLFAVVSSCARTRARVDEEGPARWEYKLVTVSELIGDVAVNEEELYAKPEQDPAQTLHAASLGPEGAVGPAAQLKELEDQAARTLQELPGKLRAYAELREKADAAFLRSLNDLGGEGWEVVWMEKGQMVLLKRRVE